jgi:hypothetical protein
VQFYDDSAVVGLSPGTLEIGISCREPDWQLSSIEQVCNSSLHPLSTTEDLYIGHRYSKLVWRNDAIENTLWLQLLLPFTTVKNLYLSEESAPGIAAALQELEGGRITEVLPSLRNIFVGGSSHRDLSRKRLGSLLRRDSCLITLSPFLTGTNTRDAARKLQPTLLLPHSSCIAQLA